MLLYVHIPFCKRKCRYCSFVSYEKSESQAERYIENVLKEAKNRKNEFIEPIDTLFIGGGTPSLLPPELLLYFTDSLFRILEADKPTEFSIESNPGTVTEEWMSAAVKAGMNRLSLGMQALQPKLLNTLGRIHTFADVKTAIRTARRYGVSNINIDLIFGIPGQTHDQWTETLEASLSLHPEHISAYGLIPEEGTPLYEDLQSGTLILPDPDLERKMYDSALSILRMHGYGQYEISNFAVDGKECRHNIGYWKQVPYVGLGVAAASMTIIQQGDRGMICRRKKNPDQLREYEEMVFGQRDPVEDLVVNPAETRFETMMLGLRMNEGVDEDLFRKMHGISIENVYGKKLHRLEMQGLLTHSGHYWKLTRRGFDIQNSILVELMDD